MVLGLELVAVVLRVCRVLSVLLSFFIGTFLGLPLGIGFIRVHFLGLIIIWKLSDIRFSCCWSPLVGWLGYSINAYGGRIIITVLWVAFSFASF